MDISFLQLPSHIKWIPPYVYYYMESLNTKSSLPGLDLAGNWKPSNKVIQSVCRVCWMWWSDERDINVT